MQDVFEITWLRSRRYLLPAVMLCLALVIGYMSVEMPKYAVAMVGASLYLICLIMRPMWAYFIMFLVSFDIYGFISISFLQLPGAFKLRDVLLLAIIVPIGANVAINKKSLEYIRSPFNKYVLSILVLVFIITLYTKFKFHVPYLTTLRMSRKYLFYLSYFIVMYYVRTKEDFRTFFKVIFVFGLIAAALMIMQFIVGGRFQIMPYVNVVYQSLSGLYVPRVYMPGGISLMTLMFAYSFWLYHVKLFKDDSTKRLLLFCFMMFLGVASFLAFGRANWAKMFCCVAVPFIFSQSKEKRRVFHISVIFMCIALLFFVFGHALGINVLDPLFKFFRRIHDTFTEIFTQTGTFGFRIRDNIDRIQLIARWPVFGAGFLHHLSAEESLKAVFVRNYSLETIDSGLVTLLTTMGFAGATVFSVLSVVFISRTIKILHRTNSVLHRGILLGSIGFYVGGIISFITLPFITSTREMPQIAMLFALVEKINQFNERKV